MEDALFTGLGVKLQGHLKILEYASFADYKAKKPSAVLLNKRNAIHKDNVAIMAIKAMTHRPDGQITYMYFGNGGTTIDNTGTVHFNAPNTGPGADLYSPVYFQLVDDTTGAIPGNQMNVRHIANSFFTDSEVRCLISANQPFGQIGFNTLPEIIVPTTILNLNTEQFAFNEIGLKLADGTLVTHVTFAPVVKSASSLLEVVYTIRVAISPPLVAVPAPVIIPVGLVGQQATTQFTLPATPFVACISVFDWKSTYLPDNGLGDEFFAPGALDKFGNVLVFANHATLVLDPLGNVISSMTQATLSDAIDAFHGSAIVNRGTGFNPGDGFYAAVINGGNYIITYFTASATVATFSKWFALLAPSATGDPTVVGAYWIGAGAFGPLNLDRPLWYETNTQSTSDPILIKVDFGIGGGNYSFSLLPSINDFINNTYAAGYPGGFVARQVPDVSCYPIGTVNLSTNLLISTGSPNGNNEIGFTLPDAGGGTNFYIYFNRAAMDASLSPSNRQPELFNVIEPAFPNGAMVKISLGVLNFATAAGPLGTGNFDGTASPYLIDNANWVDQSAVGQIPFTDEYHYISNGAALGTDAYTMQPAFVINRGGGVWWIAFYMPGIDDALAHGGTLWDTIRIFEYQTSTEVATQFFMHSCINYTSTSLPLDNNGFNDYLQTFGLELIGPSTYRIIIRGVRPDPGNQQNIYATELCEFQL